MKNSIQHIRFNSTPPNKCVGFSNSDVNSAFLTNLIRHAAKYMTGEIRRSIKGKSFFIILLLGLCAALNNVSLVVRPASSPLVQHSVKSCCTGTVPAGAATIRASQTKAAARDAVDGAVMVILQPVVGAGFSGTGFVQLPGPACSLGAG